MQSTIESADAAGLIAPLGTNPHLVFLSGMTPSPTNPHAVAMLGGATAMEPGAAVVGEASPVQVGEFAAYLRTELLAVYDIDRLAADKLFLFKLQNFPHERSTVTARFLIHGYSKGEDLDAFVGHVVDGVEETTGGGLFPLMEVADGAKINLERAKSEDGLPNSLVEVATETNNTIANWCALPRRRPTAAPSPPRRRPV